MNLEVCLRLSFKTILHFLVPAFLSVSTYSCMSVKKNDKPPNESELAKRKFKGTFAYFYHDFEPSGIVYHEQSKLFYVVSDHGLLVSVDMTGQVTESWFLDGDLEGVTNNPANSSNLYILDEKAGSVLEFSLEKEEVVRTWDLSNGGAYDDQEFEAITFLPESFGENRVLVGSQKNGKLYVYHFDMIGEEKYQEAKLIKSVKVKSNLKDLAGLNFDKNLNKIFAVYDNENSLVTLSVEDLSLMERVKVPGKNQEGVAVLGCRIFIAEDKDARVTSHEVTDLMGEHNEKCP
jgi:uncharacterized protein YjiK